MNSLDCDVLIIGAGPAGTIASRFLTLKGMSVILIDNNKGAKLKVGESLPGAVKPMLDYLGLEKWLNNSEPIINYGNISSWGNGSAHEVDFINDPYGLGWHIDRYAFDSNLLYAAIESGAQYIQGLFNKIEVNESGVKATVDDYNIEASWIIDASGRVRSVTQKLGITAWKEQLMLSLHAWFKDEEPDTRSVIESVPYGWWYSAGLPDDRRIISVQLLPKDARELFHNRNSFIYELTKTKYVYSKCRNITSCIGGVNKVDASASCLNEVTGVRWIAVGDAAMSLDPLSAQGIYNSIYTGLRGAEAVFRKLSANDDNHLFFYEKRVGEIFKKYLINCRWYYWQEQRWSNEFFWRTKHGINNLKGIRVDLAKIKGGG